MSVKKSLKSIEKEIKLMEQKLNSLIKEDHQELLTLLESIPGIGRKTGILLLVLTYDFERFNSESELCSYAGITPVIRQSGSSVRGQARISKIGNRNYGTYCFYAVLMPVNITKNARHFMIE
ncbi:MAG: transposase [Cellulophaga sp.]